MALKHPVAADASRSSGSRRGRHFQTSWIIAPLWKSRRKSPVFYAGEYFSLFTEPENTVNLLLTCGFFL